MLLIMQRCQHGGGAGLVIRTLLCGADSTELRDSYQTHPQLSVFPTLSLRHAVSCHYNYRQPCLSVCMSLCVSIHLSIRLYVCPSICLIKCLFVCLSVCPSNYLSVCLFSYPICLCILQFIIHPSMGFICLSVHLSIRSICLSVRPSLTLNDYSPFNCSYLL